VFFELGEFALYTMQQGFLKSLLQTRIVPGR
jgi:hypothetical protein